MRLPGAPGASHDIHYLTDFYIQKFGLEGKVVPFNNFDKNALLKFYNSDPITIEGIVKQDPIITLPPTFLLAPSLYPPASPHSLSPPSLQL